MTLRIATPADLRQARDRLGMTQRQVADLLGVPEGTVSRLERASAVQVVDGVPILDSRWQSHLTLLFEHLRRDVEDERYATDVLGG